MEITDFFSNQLYLKVFKQYKGGSSTHTEHTK